MGRSTGSPTSPSPTMKPTSSSQEVAPLSVPIDTLAATRPDEDMKNPFDLTGRVAVVTGGTRGLGLAMARAFGQAGASVVIVSRKPDACEEVVAALRAEGAKAT